MKKEFLGCIVSVETVPTGCILSVGTVPMGCILSVGTVPMGCILIQIQRFMLYQDSIHPPSFSVFYLPITLGNKIKKEKMSGIFHLIPLY